MPQQQITSNIMVWFSFASLALLYSVMLVGVYITASHQGLSCPDWPLCPNGFDFPPKKYFFEHVHRVMAVMTGGLIFATAVYAVKNIKNSNSTKTAIVACIIVSIQILLGMLVVYTKLESRLVASHLSIGVLLFAMVLMTLFLSVNKYNR
jgi:cytochrome c oxidase assembly protein subunit 15